MRAHGPWTILSSRLVHRDPWVTLTLDDVIRPDGQPGTFTTIAVKPSVSVLALDEAGNVHLTEEFRYAVGHPSIEVVSGGIEPGEDELSAGKRELAEELGIVAAEWIDLGTTEPISSIVLLPTRLYLAKGLTFGDHAREGTEAIRHVTMTLAEAVDAVMASRITHGASTTLILKAAIVSGRPLTIAVNAPPPPR
jgi:ADP-ribose pyrophosphatase